MHWKSIPIHIIDFEGTPSSGIIEYGVVTLLNGRIANTHTRFCRPFGQISLEDTALHGISLSETKNTLPFAHEWNLFSELRRTGPLAAHHAHTEHMLLKSVWPYPSKSPDFLDPEYQSTTWDPWIDSCQLYRYLHPELNSHKLMSLISSFRLEEELRKLALLHCPQSRQKPHCALYDALASALLLLSLGELPEFQDMSLEWLITKSATTPKKVEDLEQLSLGFA